MKKEMSIAIGLALLLGGVLAVQQLHSTASPEEALSPEEIDPVKLVTYSCAGGSVAEQSFFFSLQREDEKVLFSCEYFGDGQDGGDRKKHTAEEAELPAEVFTELLQLLAAVHFPEEKAADDGILALDAESYSLVVCYASGKRQILESNAPIAAVEACFRSIEHRDDWRRDDN